MKTPKPISETSLCSESTKVLAFGQCVSGCSRTRQDQGIRNSVTFGRGGHSHAESDFQPHGGDSRRLRPDRHRDARRRRECGRTARRRPARRSGLRQRDHGDRRGVRWWSPVRRHLQAEGARVRQRQAGGVGEGTAGGGVRPRPREERDAGRRVLHRVHDQVAAVRQRQAGQGRDLRLGTEQRSQGCAVIGDVPDHPQHLRQQEGRDRGGVRRRRRQQARGRLQQVQDPGLWRLLPRRADPRRVRQGSGRW